MYIDLTTQVSMDSPLIAWAKAQDNPHIAMGHIGTHLDTYQKTPIPLAYFKSEGVLFDVRDIPEVFPEHIDLSRLCENAFVLFRTGQIEKYAYGEKAYFNPHPQLSHELIHLLWEKKIRFIGLDSPGIRQHQEHEDADRKCEEKGIYVIENLTNLNKLNEKPMTIYTMWLDDAEKTGLSCRVIAEIESQ